MKDSEIIELYFLRDQRAIVLTERKYGRLIKKLIRSILRSREDAEECLSDVYIRLWQSIPPERPENFRAYVCSVARSAALSKYRYITAKKRSGEVVGLDDTYPQPDGMPLADRIALKDAINDFLDGLPPDARNIFIRKYYFFESVREIAVRYSFSESKVKSSLAASREKLEKFLKKRGLL